MHAYNPTTMKRSFAAALFAVAVFSIAAFGQERTADAIKPARNRVPVSYGLVVDNSGSFRLLLDKVIRLVSEIVEENGPEDETFLVTFVDTSKISLRQEFTNDTSNLRDAAENMFIEGGQTAIIDAVKSSADYLRENAIKDANRVRVLILITDGDEAKSTTTIDAVLKSLKDEKIRIFAVGLAEAKPVVKLLNRLTNETGGQMYVPRNSAELESSVKSLNLAIRTP